MLKDAKDKAVREAGEAFLRADAIGRGAEDAEALLRGAIEENFQLLGRIKELETQLERGAVIVEENSRLQGLIKELEAQLGAAKKKAVEAAFKAVADFRVSVKYQDEKVEFVTDAYDLGR